MSDWASSLRHQRFSQFSPFFRLSAKRVERMPNHFRLTLRFWIIFEFFASNMRFLWFGLQLNAKRERGKRKVTLDVVSKYELSLTLNDNNNKFDRNILISYSQESVSDWLQASDSLSSFCRSSSPSTSIVAFVWRQTYFIIQSSDAFHWLPLALSRFLRVQFRFKHDIHFWEIHIFI